MDNAHFILTTDISGYRALPHGEGRILDQYAELSERLSATDPSLAGLFAEPAIGRMDEDADAARPVAWYSYQEGQAVRLSDAAPDERSAVEAILRERLTQIQHILAEADNDGLLRRSLLVPSLNDVLVIRGRPVLTNWGCVPRDLTEEETALERHFSATLGQFADFELFGDITAPVTAATQTPTAVPTGAAAAAAVGTAAVAGAAMSSAGEDAEAEPMAAQSVPSPGPAAAQGGISGGGGGGPGGPAGPTGPQGMPPYESQRPWYFRGPFLVLIALAIGLSGLLVGWYLSGSPLLLAHESESVDPTVTADAVARQDAINDGLRRQRDRLRNAFGEDVCNADLSALQSTLPVAPYAACPVPPNWPGYELLSPVGGQPQEGRAGEAGEASGGAGDGADDAEAGDAEGAEEAADDQGANPVTTVEVARRLERSAALVLVPAQGGGLSMGSGFFITPSLLVTNRHVIEKGDPNAIYVTSEHLGAVYQGKVIAVAPHGGAVGNRDYAIVSFNEELQVDPLLIASSVDNLATIVVAGYPGFLTDIDPRTKRLLEDGDVSAAPSMIFDAGEVSIVQTPSTGIPIVIHTAQMSPGNSGGPLLDLCGRVVGINTFITTDPESGRRDFFSLASGDLMSFLRENNAGFRSSDEVCG